MHDLGKVVINPLTFMHSLASIPPYGSFALGGIFFKRSNMADAKKTTPKKAKAKAKTGRKTKLTQNLVDEICYAISTSSKGVATLCKENKHWPSDRTIWSWVANNDAFLQRYTRAKEFQADIIAEKAVHTASNKSNDFYTDAKGNDIPNSVNVNRDRLIVDTLKWKASVLKPSKYGNKVQQELTGKDGGAVEVNTETKLTLEELHYRTDYLFKKHDQSDA